MPLPCAGEWPAYRAVLFREKETNNKKTKENNQNTINIKKHNAQTTKNKKKTSAALLSYPKPVEHPHSLYPIGFGGMACTGSAADLELRDLAPWTGRGGSNSQLTTFSLGWKCCPPKTGPKNKSNPNWETTKEQTEAGQEGSRQRERQRDVDDVARTSLPNYDMGREGSRKLEGKTSPTYIRIPLKPRHRTLPHATTMLVRPKT